MNEKNGLTLIIVFLALTTFGFIVYFIIRKIINIFSLDSLIKQEVLVINSKDCKTKKEFEDKFRTCQPASVNFKFSKYVVYRYEILGREGDRCKVKSYFVKNINPNLVNKEMISLLDPKLDFNKAVKQDLYRNATGPLAKIMKGEKRDWE